MVEEQAEPVTPRADHRRSRGLVWLTLIVVLIVALAVDFVLLGVLAISLATGLSLALGIVGVYSIIVALVASSNAPRQIVNPLISYNLAEYLAGNAKLLGAATAALANAVDPRKTTLEPSNWFAKSIRTVIVSYLVYPASYVYLTFHIVIVLPLAYLAYAAASLTVAATLSSARSLEIEERDTKTGEEYKVLGIQWIRDHRVQATSFMVALPSSIAALLLQAL